MFERNTDARDASEVTQVMWGTPNRERGLGDLAHLLGLVT